MFFGQKLKELRLKYAKMGMRNFSIEMGMGGAEYSSLERGYIPPPEDKKWMHDLLELLQIPPWSEDEMGLYICWKKPFVMQLMDEDIFVTHALNSDGSSASLKKLKKVSDWMRDIAIEHNKKAREYNESR